jgi:hypothetical protein
MKEVGTSQHHICEFADSFEDVLEHYCDYQPCTKMDYADSQRH